MALNRSIRAKFKDLLISRNVTLDFITGCFEFKLLRSYKLSKRQLVTAQRTGHLH